MNNYKILYLSTALSDNIYFSVVSSCNSFKPTFSGVGFDRNVALGLSSRQELIGVSLYPIPSFPKYKKLFEQEQHFQQEQFNCLVAPSLNLPIVKEFSYFHYVKNFVKKNIRHDEKIVVIVSGLYRTLLRPAKWIQKKYNAKIFTIVPDLPELMSSYRTDYSRTRKLLNKLDVNLGKNVRMCSDGYILLSPFMNEKVNLQGKPFIVVDGLCDVSAFPEKQDKSGKPYLMYAGKISKNFGVDRLVDAFRISNIDGYELRLFGDGDYAEDLRAIAALDDRIHYEGVVPHAKVLSYEQNASLLIDPRPTNTELVKMSFPSKFIEYLLSATPVLATPLPCFGIEYDDFYYKIEDESVEGIARSIERVLCSSKEVLQNKGASAKRFILENKTITVQCGKILEFVERVLANGTR